MYVITEWMNEDPNQISLAGSSFTLTNTSCQHSLPVAKRNWERDLIVWQGNRQETNINQMLLVFRTRCSHFESLSPILIKSVGKEMKSADYFVQSWKDNSNVARYLSCPIGGDFLNHSEFTVVLCKQVTLMWFCLWVGAKDWGPTGPDLAQVGPGNGGGQD